MKIAKKQKSKKKRILIILSIVVLVIAAGGITYAILSTRMASDENTVDYNPPTEEQRKAGEEIKQESIKSEEEAEQNDEADVGEVVVDITSVNQNNGQLQLRTLVHTLDNGECTLTLSGPNNQSKQYSASTQSFASNSSCQGFDVPVSELSSGEWRAEIIFTSDQSRGVAMQNITIE